MTFILVAAAAAAGTFFALSLHRFCATQADARANLIYIEVLRKYARWVVRRGRETVKAVRPGSWPAAVRAWPVWRAPRLERWLLAAFGASFAYLAGSGLFYALFIPAGLSGYPLLGHVCAGGVFAVSLAAIVFLKGRHFVPAARPVVTLAALLPRRGRLTPELARSGAFWAFAAAGFLLTVSAVVPMLPLLRTPGQEIMLGLHRYAAVASAAAAAVFVDLELFLSRRAVA